MPSDDIETTHAGGQTVVRGVDREAVKELREGVRGNTDGSGTLRFRGVKKIDILRPGTEKTDQTIYGEPND